MDNLSDEEKRQIAGKTNFCFLSFCTTAAFICGLYSSAYCNFVGRSIEFVDDDNNDDLEGLCTALNLTSTQETYCNTLLGPHGVGFNAWYATVPINQQVCVGYTQFIPNVGWVTPDFDTKFNSARGLAFAADVCGAFAWFSICFTSCCPISQERLKGLSFYFLLATLFQGLTLLIFRSNVCEAGFFAQYFPDQKETLENIVESVDCSLDTGAKMAIASTVLYFVCLCLIPSAVAPGPVMYGQYDEKDEAGQQQEGDAEAGPQQEQDFQDAEEN